MEEDLVVDAAWAAGAVDSEAMAADLAVVASAEAAVVLAEAEPLVGGNMKQPKWIQKFLSTSEIESVIDVIKHAETKTSGEIVPIIVRRSSSVAHLPFLITCLLLILCLLMNGHNFLDYEFKLYFSNSFALFGSYLALGLITVLFYFVSLKLSSIACIQRFLISDAERSAQVSERALLEFYLNHVTKTEFKTGILIFVSLMERQTIVLGDEAISQKITKETWQEIVNMIIESIKEDKTSVGLKNAIIRCGEILNQHFPSSSKNPNELENHLIIKE